MGLEGGLLFRFGLGFFFRLSRKKNVPENKQRNLSLLWTDAFIESIIPAVGGNSAVEDMDKIILLEYME